MMAEEGLGEGGGERSAGGSGGGSGGVSGTRRALNFLEHTDGK